MKIAYVVIMIAGWRDDKHGKEGFYQQPAVSGMDG